MIIRSLAVLLLAALVLLLTGCWDLDELEDTAFLEVLGIDSAPGGDELVLTAEVVLPTSALAGGGGMGGSTGGPQDYIIQAKGKTLNMALNELREIMVRKTFTGFVGYVIIGEEAARKDMMRILEFFERNPPLRRSAFVMVTPGKASDVLTTINPRSIVLNNSLEGILKRTEQTGVAFSARMGNDIFEPLAIDGIEPIATRIVPKDFPPQAQGGGGAGNTEGGDPGTVGFLSSPGEPATLARKMGDHFVEGMAVFKGPRLVGWLDEKEARGWAWIKNQMYRGIMVVLEPRGARGDSDPVTFRYVRGKSSIKLSLEGDQVTALVTIKMKGEVVEWGTSRDLIDPKIIRSLEADMAASVKRDVEEALEKAQWELGSDIFGFGFSLFRQHQREWKTTYKDSWDEIFPTMPVEVKVEAQIVNTGPVIRAFKLKP